MKSERRDDPSIRANSTLRELGFGAHETVIILALNRVGSCTVARLSKETGIHHANLYAVLDSLAGRGIVTSTEKRPRVYDFAPLTHLRNLMAVKIEQLISDLTELQKQRETDSSIPALIYTLKGRNDVKAKMLSMIANAQESLLLVAPSVLDLGDEILDAFRTAAQNGVTIRAIHAGEQVQTDFQFLQRIKPDTMAVDLVVDNQEALIAMPDLSICGWADIPMIAWQLQEFLEQTWNIAEEVS